MKELREYFKNELPHIESYLDGKTAELNGLIRDVARYVLLGGGKRIRPVLTVLTARCLGYTGEEAYPIASAVELLHSATLIHDDILDGAVLRRGKKAAHLQFGTKEIILAGDALLALANKIGADYDKPRINSYLAKGIMETAQGEILEIEWLAEPSVDRNKYMEIVTGKTACLIRTACQCGAVLADGSPEIQDAAGEYGLNLGIAFQLVDDALDYVASPDDMGKPAGGDLDEGKITLPLILFLESLEEDERMDYFSKIKSHNLTPKEKTWIIDQVKKDGCAVRTRDFAAEYAKKAGEAIKDFPAGLEFQCLNQVLDFVLTRHK